MVPAEGIIDRLGPFRHNGHKIWSWYICQLERRLYQYEGGAVSCYEPPRVVGKRRRPNQWTKTQEGVEANQLRGTPCSTRELRGGDRAVMGEIRDTPRESSPMDILEVLRSWGGLWMWQELTLTYYVD